MRNRAASNDDDDDAKAKLDREHSLITLTQTTQSYRNMLNPFGPAQHKECMLPPPPRWKRKMLASTGIMMKKKVLCETWREREIARRGLTHFLLSPSSCIGRVWCFKHIWMCETYALPFSRWGGAVLQ